MEMEMRNEDIILVDSLSNMAITKLHFLGTVFIYPAVVVSSHPPVQRQCFIKPDHSFQMLTGQP